MRGASKTNDDKKREKFFPVIKKKIVWQANEEGKKMAYPSQVYTPVYPLKWCFV
jgi:hypothetical protein